MARAGGVRPAIVLAVGDALTFETLQQARRDQCWTDVLRYEAMLHTSMLSSKDCMSGCKGLEESKRRLREVAKEEAKVDQSYYLWEGEEEEEGDEEVEEVKEMDMEQMERWRRRRLQRIM